MTTFTINGHEVLAVQVPKGADDIDLDIDPKEDWYCLSYVRKIDDEESGFYGEWEGYDVAIPPGNWQLIVNKPCSEWSEAEAAEFVERVDYDVPPSPGNDFQGDWRTGYRDYNSDEETGCSEYPFVRTALASLHSLLISKELNPAETVLLSKKV